MQQPSIYWEDLDGSGETVLGTINVSKDEMLEFARRYDPQPFHVDEQAARLTVHGGLIASGMLTCSLVIRLMCESFLRDSANLGSPGIDELRWPKAVRAGDVLTVKRTLLESRPTSKPGRGLVSFLISVANQHDEIVMTMRVANIFLRRDASQTEQRPIPAKSAT